MSAPGFLRRLARDEAGATLVEFAFALALLLLLFFGLIDFGRLAHQWVAAEKATSLGARIASVRPPACLQAVPDSYVRPTGSTLTVPFGTSCTHPSSPCAVPAVVSCTGNMTNATVSEIWGRIAPLLPSGATAANLRFRYAPDYARQVGFLGGPYVPAVTVEITGLVFQFATPLGGLADLASGTTGSTISNAILMPAMSASVPGEDLALGNDG